MRRVQTDFHVLAVAPANGLVEVVQPAKNTKRSRKQYLSLAEVGAAPAGFVSPTYPTGADQALSGTGALGALDLNANLTTVNTTGAATATMAAGLVAGHMKTIRMIGDIGDCVITIAGDGIVSCTLNDVNDECELSWTGTGWTKISNSGCVLA